MKYNGHLKKSLEFSQVALLIFAIVVLVLLLVFMATGPVEKINSKIEELRNYVPI